MEYPFTTSFMAFAISIIFVILSLRVSILRKKHNLDFGLGEEIGLTRAIRAHGNLAESAPIILVLLLMLEMKAGAGLELLLIAHLYLAARIIGLLVSFISTKFENVISIARIITMLGTLLPILALGILLMRAVIYTI